jgi:Skp family chaperone for outer membrane proteins
MKPEVRAAKIKELEARRAGFQKKVQDRQAAIQNGLGTARTQVEKALAPILEKIMVERGSNLLLDRGLVVLGATSLDVTTVVIQRLNTALPKVTVTPVAPKAVAKPAGAAKPPG